MFEVLMPLYSINFRCILVDFLGNGQSDRIKKFSPDIWHDEALQTIALIEHLNCEKVNLIGTSGGAWAAVNAALERPDLIHMIVADSFDGRTLNENFSDNLLSERRKAKNDLQSRQYYVSTIIPDAKVYIFNQGGHPAILTNAEEFSQLIQGFLSADSAL